MFGIVSQTGRFLIKMVENKGNSCRYPHLGAAIFQPSKIKLIQVQGYPFDV